MTLTYATSEKTSPHALPVLTTTRKAVAPSIALVNTSVKLYMSLPVFPTVEPGPIDQGLGQRGR